ncbi:hypothetical protein H1R20_g10610, partial [Candolleomyces eurysporus]
MSIFDGASHITINGGVISNNTSGHYIDKSRQNVTNHYGSQNVSQTTYVDSNNDYSNVEASEFQQQQHVEHVQTRPASFHAAPAPNTSGKIANHNPYYTAGQYPNPIELRKTRANLRTTTLRARNADFSQHQQYFEQNSIPQTDYLAPSAQQGDWTEPSGSTSGKSSKTKKEKPKDSDRKGKKPQRATVETTDDEDDLRAKSKKDEERDKKISDTLGPVLERLDDSDDGFGDLLKPPRKIPLASVPPAPASSVQLQSTGTGGATSTGSTSQQLRPISPTSQSASGRPAAAATASAPAVVNSSITSGAVASASTSSSVRVPEQGQASIGTPPLASTSNTGRVTPPGPTRQEELQAQLAVDFSRMSSTLSDGSEKKKKKKGVFSRMNPFGKKKEKGGVAGLEDFNLE